MLITAFSPPSLIDAFWRSYFLAALCLALLALAQCVPHSHSWELILDITSTNASLTRPNRKKCHLASFLTYLFWFVMGFSITVLLPLVYYSNDLILYLKKKGMNRCSMPSSKISTSYRICHTSPAEYLGNTHSLFFCFTSCCSSFYFKSNTFSLQKEIFKSCKVRSHL